MKKIFTILLLSAAMIGGSGQISAQTTIYTQNFDATHTLPAGWYASPGSWVLDTTGGNASTGYTGSTGGNNVVIKDTTGRLGSDSLISEAISTVGYSTITLSWGARFSKHFADSGSTISLYWSANGSAWANLAYTENANNSTWALENGATPVSLPAGAANQSSLKLMWVADIHFTPSGTYRMDDLNLSGTPIAGIDNVNANDAFAHIYTTSNSNINIHVEQPLTESLQVELYDLTGQLISKSAMDSQRMSIDAKNLSAGLYLVRVSDINRSVVNKVIIR